MSNPLKIGIYSPYLDSVGGGERYMLSIAEILSQKSDVDVFLDQHLWGLGAEMLKRKLSSHLNIDLSKTKFILAPLGEGSKSTERLFFLKNYDVIFCLTDGSIFYSSAKKSILHIQTPLINLQLKNIKNQIKLRSWDLIIYNSQFTKSHVEKQWKRKNEVVYPPVDVSPIKPLKKEKIILTVGRFFGFLREKKHEVMITAFKEIMRDKNVDGWSFHLVGSAQEGDKPYVDELRKLAKNFPIYLHPNLPYAQLVRLYGETSLYWHAMGFGEEDPTKSEHFGITTVEAMAGGAIPVVIKKGGQTEIVQDGKNGMLWETVEQLKEKTVELVNDSAKRQKLSKEASNRAKDFSKENFQKLIEKIAYEK